MTTETKKFDFEEWEKQAHEDDEDAWRIWPDTDGTPLNIVVFPKAFPNTAGPFGGIGGQSITTFTLNAIGVGDGRALIYWGYRFWKKVDNFQFQVSFR